MKNKKTIIKVRRGIGNVRYCACDISGNPIRGFDKLSEIRKHWKGEIQWGYVELVRELDKTPNTEMVNETKRMIETILKSYAKKS